MEKLEEKINNFQLSVANLLLLSASKRLGVLKYSSFKR